MSNIPDSIQRLKPKHTRLVALAGVIIAIIIITGGVQIVRGMFIANQKTATVKAPLSGNSPQSQSGTKSGSAMSPGNKSPESTPEKDEEQQSASDKQDSGTKQGTTQPQSGGSATSPNGGGTTGSQVARNSLGIPVSGTVLTLSGLNYNLYNNMPQKFQGIFSKSPYSIVKIEYPASLASDSITKGVTALNTALRTTKGPKIVLAQSQGAQVASRWMRQYANDTSAPGATDVIFILTGNPLRSTGGYLIGRTEVGGTKGQPTPTDTKWPIIDFARRYDGWADWVHNAGNTWAVDNAEAGKNTFHTDYQSINLYASTHTIWKSGNTTYILTQEDILPLWKNNADYPLGVRTAMRAHIEMAYNRPANDPKVHLLPIESIEWENKLREWGVSF